MSSGTLIAGLLISSVGFGLFLFGRKQRRGPPWVVGMLMMGLPYLVVDPLWMGIAATLLLIGMRTAVRYE